MDSSICSGIDVNFYIGFRLSLKLSRSLTRQMSLLKPQFPCSKLIYDRNSLKIVINYFVSFFLIWNYETYNFFQESFTICPWIWSCWQLHFDIIYDTITTNHSTLSAFFSPFFILCATIKLKRARIFWFLCIDMQSHIRNK